MNFIHNKNHCNTQRHYALQCVITDHMKVVADTEELSAEEIRQQIASGNLVIPANILHKKLIPIGIGIHMRTKINANIGNSSVFSNLEEELEKLHIAVHFGADTVMDLSTGEPIDTIRRAIIDASPVPVGTVPIYQAMAKAENVTDLGADDFLDMVEEQAKDGVDFMTIHAGVLREHLHLTASRLMGIVSRGGSILTEWMKIHNQQNPFYQYFNRILEIARTYDVTLSLGDGLRPGCLADAGDKAQFAELETIGELTRKAWNQGVQVIVEGPGHVPFDQIQMQIEKMRHVCHDAPLYVLGPLVTDVAPGYDHITSAIGGTMAAYAGASFLCYVTPKEHLGLPGKEDVRDGVIASKIAAHAADIAQGKAGARKRDDEISRARFNFDWKKQFELALDPEKARDFHDVALPDELFKTINYCSMCGPKFCAMKLYQEEERIKS